MIDYIRHSISTGVLSIYNPLLGLKEPVKRVVNRDFIHPIVKTFFAELKGIEQYTFLDTSLIKTEVDFAADLDFVRRYLYRTVVTEISRQEGRIHFKPRFTVTFDEDITPEVSTTVYPYPGIFGDQLPYPLSNTPFNIRFGTMNLGEEPLIYFIRLHLPTLIRFLKIQEHRGAFEHFQRYAPTDTALGKLYQSEYEMLQREIAKTSDLEERGVLEGQSAHLRKLMSNPGQALSGQTGQLRINLSWETIDDLDLHVIDPSGNEISYSNKQARCQGKTGRLDVDANAGTWTTTPPPQENIFWETAPPGNYKVYVNLYTKRGSQSTIPYANTNHGDFYPW